MKKEVSQVLANVWLDTAAAPFLYRPRAYALAVELMGADKLLMGSDYPLLPVSRYRRELGAEEAGFSPDVMAGIMGDNALKVIT
jgi:predicted TIM-barrel fold metal-dependent hydrolase